MRLSVTLIGLGLAALNIQSDTRAMIRIRLGLAIALSLVLSAWSLSCTRRASEDSASTCTYETWEWDTLRKQSSSRRLVKTTRVSLTPEERGSFPGCSVCSEDQVVVDIDGLPSIQVCRAFQERTARALQAARDAGFPIKSLVGYRVGRTKGPINSEGKRTQFSLHSYGVAIDVNSELNGLYDDCVNFGVGCRLLRGGAWVRGRPGAIDPSTEIYRAFAREGLKWGGELSGKQKDFMHFSPSGD